MGELVIRRNRGFAIPHYQTASKADKSSGSSQAPSVTATAGFTVSETLRQLMSRVAQAETHTRESRRTLQTGEAVLAEVRDSLGRMAELARRSAGEGEPDRTALQEELERLCGEIDRMISTARTGGAQLFLEGEIGDECGELPDAALGESSAGQEEAPSLPDWLMKGIVQNGVDPKQLLTALGLDSTASGADILAALADHPLESSWAAGRLAALYLGAVIAGGGSPEGVGPAEALDGLRQLLEQTSRGVPLDQAIELLTNGEFIGISDFQAQFTGGTAPGLQEFLTGLLLSDSAAPPLDNSVLLSILAGLEGNSLDLMMGLLTALQSSAPPSTPSTAGQGQTAEIQEPIAHTLVLRFGDLQAAGRDPSGLSFHAAESALTISGAEDVAIQGSGAQAVLITGSGQVTLRNLTLPELTVSSQEARIFSTGTSVLSQVRLQSGASLTLEGSGMLNIRCFQAGDAGALRLTGGAVILSEGEKDTFGSLTIPVFIDGPVSLAAQAVSVRDFSGKPLEPFDIIWKALLPGWTAVSSITADGKQVKMALMNGDPARLWLAKGDPSHGYSTHTLVIRGRDQSGRPLTRYAYLHWNQSTQTFEEIAMYPNPFAVTGGEAGRDWIYEEEPHTLRILSAQVTAISGGAGTDTNQTPFSGRIALADGIGSVELSLCGVVCQVTSGRALDLGRANEVTLILENGTRNCFESGAGCAGISLGEGTSVCIDRARTHSGSEDDGILTVSGGAGGAGIGRDCNAGRERSGHILIRGGVITAAGTGGGAGIGAGKRGALGTILIVGGTVVSTGGAGGGAGIGGAVGAPVGDISIRGGSITAAAVYHAAAIGAGVQGECGDILITGTARIVKALGGNPGADIGACLFGGCGSVVISGAADIGGARLWTRPGISLRMGEDTVTLPQFRLSSAALRLNRLRVSTREDARAAKPVIEAGQRLISRIQMAYSSLYAQLEQNSTAIYSVQRYFTPAEGLVRDTDEAGSLLDGILLHSSQAIRTHNKRGAEDPRQFLQ